jgi:hypothetical protein
MADGGNVALVNDPPLVLTGLHQGNNLSFEVMQQGGSLVLGDAKTPATLNATTAGLISLVADSITTGNPNSSITAPFGTVELAPFSPINESVAGTNSSGQLLIDSTLLSIINTGKVGPLDTLVIGGFTDQPANATAPVASASGVTIDGPLDLSARTFTLNLLSNGTVSEPSGPLTVPNVIGSAVGTFSLANPNNAINQSFGISAANGDVILVDKSDLLLTGQQSGNNLFDEVARQGGVLRLGSEGPVLLTAGTGGRISLVADAILPSGADSTISVPAGTLELAPFSAINTSLSGKITAGQLLIDAGVLSLVSPAINTLVIGGFTNVPAGATISSPSAASVTIDGMVDLAPLATTLDLEAIGPVTQSAPILNVGTLLGTTGSTTLTNPANTVAVFGNYIATSGLALTDARDLLIAGAVVTTGSAMFTITGALSETGSLTANQLSGSASASASLPGSNTISVLGDFTAATGFTLNDDIGLTVNVGKMVNGGTDVTITDAGLLNIAGTVTGTAVALSGTSIAIGGAVVAPASTSLIAASGIAEGGSITTALLSGTAGTGAASLTGSNAISALDDFTAVAGFTLNDGIGLTVNLGKTVNGTSSTTITDTGPLAIEGTVIGTTVALSGTSIAIDGAVNGPTSLALTAADGITEGGSITTGTLSGTAGTGAALLTGSNTINVLNGFSAGTVFALDDGVDLLLAGTLNAGRIAIRDSANQITLGDGATIITGGTTRPPGPLQQALEPANGAPGALLQSAGFAQIGSSTVFGQSGGPATVQISTTGNAQFDPPLGLTATGTWLILNLTTGTAAGSVFVNALDVTYTTPGSTNLLGTIDGVTGGRAASLGFIQPALNVNYLFNGCVIAAAQCSTTSLNTGLTATLGAIYPLIAIRPPSLGSLPDLVLIAMPMLQPRPPQLTDPDVVPPNITYLDY